MWPCVGGGAGLLRYSLRREQRGPAASRPAHQAARHCAGTRGRRVRARPAAHHTLQLGRPPPRPPETKPPPTRFHEGRRTPPHQRACELQRTRRPPRRCSSPCPTGQELGPCQRRTHRLGGAPLPPASRLSVGQLVLLPVAAGAAPGLAAGQLLQLVRKLQRPRLERGAFEARLCRGGGRRGGAGVQASAGASDQASWAPGCLPAKKRSSAATRSSGALSSACWRLDR
jgi:hypothetical protein